MSSGPSPTLGGFAVISSADNTQADIEHQQDTRDDEESGEILLGERVIEVALPRIQSRLREGGCHNDSNAPYRANG
jgi:hypothetical protein